jgi:hypothetical protein
VLRSVADWFLVSGLVQFVESMPVAEVLATEGTIQNFFRRHNPSENGPYGIAADVMDTYVRSCGQSQNTIFGISITPTICLCFQRATV